MNNDEQSIRQLVAIWMAATKAKDTETILNLISDDAIFLVAGQPAISKSDFAKIAERQAEDAATEIESCSEIREINVLGDWAFMWTQLRVIVKSTSGAGEIKREGHTLSILKKENGQWKMARDANLLAPVQHS